MFCDEDAGKAAELGATYVKNYFSTVVEHYEIGGKHFGKGYEYYASAAEMIGDRAASEQPEKEAELDEEQVIRHRLSPQPLDLAEPRRGP